MKAGDLKHRVALLRPVVTVDARGNRRTVYEHAADLWAGKKDVSSRDFFAAMAAQMADVVTFFFRWRENIAPDWRVRHAGREYEILQINHLGYKRDYMLIKTRLVRAGKGAQP